MFTRFRFVNGTPNPAWAQIKISTSTGDQWVPPAPLQAPPQGYVDHVVPAVQAVIRVDGYLATAVFPAPPPPPPPPALTATITPQPGDDFLEATVQAAHDSHANLVGCLIGFTDQGVAVTMQMH